MLMNVNTQFGRPFQNYHREERWNPKKKSIQKQRPSCDAKNFKSLGESLDTVAMLPRTKYRFRVSTCTLKPEFEQVAPEIPRIKKCVNSSNNGFMVLAET